MLRLDTEWVDQACDGNRDAFGRLFEVYQQPVYNLAFRFLGSPLEAEDAVQETFLRAYAHLDTYCADHSFRTWLLSITAHVCIDQLRHEGVLGIGRLGGDVTTETGLDPETTALRHESKLEIERLLACLPLECRQLLVLRYWYDLSYREMSQLAGLSESAIKSRLYRARRQLARLAYPRQSLRDLTLEADIYKDISLS